ncbi:GCN5 family acetyltransferase [Elysia marginata]|uniref:GCN5 family acetyltransferase n=1 Tax=Elysia marginata TaxID=1093978 RepID=A0AAV4JI30_9GAST|nr:GCN5 family acetyltransferase [Elysia marginata]
MGVAIVSNALELREIQKNELPTLLKWYQDAEWNPGLNDLDTFAATETGHFFVGLLNDNIVSCIAATIYQSHYAFLGYYFVEPESLRGKGYGIQVWDYALDQLARKGIQNIGLDGVIEQVDNYARKEFVSAYLHQRHVYEVNGNETCATTVSNAPPSINELIAFDAQYVSEARPSFAHAFLTADPTRKHAVIRASDGAITGYSTIRQATEGYRMGPLHALNPTDAADLINSLCAGLPKGRHVYLDIPEANAKRQTLIDSLNLSPIAFDCMRMYKGQAPSVNLNEIFAVTSIEMG